MRPLALLPSAALLVLLAGAARAQDGPAEWQIVLLKPPGCQACTYTEEMLKRRGQVQSAELHAAGAPSVTARIVRRPSSELSPTERQEVAELPGFDPLLWAQQAAFRASQVLLLRNGRVVAAGNIAD